LATIDESNSISTLQVSKQKQQVIIELKKADMKFSAGHFTIFSASHRERLHGHNFSVTAKLTTFEHETGISFDYNKYKKIIVNLCESLDEYFLLPGKSPFLTFEEKDGYVYAVFDQERIPFLKKDVLILPVTNITLEELSRWFLNNLLEHKSELEADAIIGVSVSVYASVYQSATNEWVAKVEQGHRL
jgi:6-pyruvoyltetrahydropterin/6-carboxytetrahydropterin synthase